MPQGRGGLRRVAWDLQRCRKHTPKRTQMLNFSATLAQPDAPDSRCRALASGMVFASIS